MRLFTAGKCIEVRTDASSGLLESHWSFLPVYAAVLACRNSGRAKKRFTRQARKHGGAVWAGGGDKEQRGGGLACAHEVALPQGGQGQDDSPGFASAERALVATSELSNKANLWSAL